MTTRYEKLTRLMEEFESFDIARAEDNHAQTSAETVRLCLRRLRDGDEDIRSMYKEFIEGPGQYSLPETWGNGSGTDGAALSALFALGFIDDFPYGKIKPEFEI